VLKFLMDNQIEEFYQSLNDEKKLKEIINNLDVNDPILLIKLIQSLQIDDEIQENH
jgi:hypothetical protein